MVNPKQRPIPQRRRWLVDKSAQKSLLEEADEQREETIHSSSHDCFWDDEEIQSLFKKEKVASYITTDDPRSSLSHARTEAVQWILNIKSHYGFTALTTIRAVYFVDTFLSNLSFHHEDKPWMTQLASVACLSLAAKLEETHVPLLTDLQVNGLRKQVFQGKTIQRMELLVLSSLKWKMMNIVTPLSYVDHFVRRLGFEFLGSEFLRKCENILLSCISDSRTVRYLPSVLAMATMLHVIHEADHISNPIDCKNQLLRVLKINKEEMDDSYGLVEEILSNTLKRKAYKVQSSPDAALNSSMTSSDSSNDRYFKKIRVHEQKMKLSSSSSSISKQS